MPQTCGVFDRGGEDPRVGRDPLEGLNLISREIACGDPLVLSLLSLLMPNPHPGLYQRLMYTAPHS